MKYVYIIQSLDEGYYKIGVSKHPHNRLKQLQTGNSSKLKLVEVYQSEYAHSIEKTMHRRYSTFRKEGEWFELSLENEWSFIKECKSIEHGIRYVCENSTLFL